MFKINLFNWNWKLFIESVLKYACTLKKIENEIKGGKKWGFKKLYIKVKKS